MSDFDRVMSLLDEQIRQNQQEIRTKLFWIILGYMGGWRYQDNSGTPSAVVSDSQKL